MKSFVLILAGQTRVLRALPPRVGASVSVRSVRAISETVAVLELTHSRPAFKIEICLVER